MGFSQHAGMVIVCDGTPRPRPGGIERVLWNDPATGVMRHADAGYDIALDVRAREGARPARHPRVTRTRPARGGPQRDALEERRRRHARDRRLAAGAGLDDFDWRVSMAEVREDGPFSGFPGVDRILTVLEGGLRLTVAGAGVFDLSPGSAPATFDGAAPASARLTAGPVLDLNVMTRRGAALARVDRLASPADVLRRPGVCLVFALGDGVRLHGVGRVHSLDRYDGLLTEAGFRIAASAEAQAIVISLTTSGRVAGGAPPPIGPLNAG